MGDLTHFECTLPLNHSSISQARAHIAAMHLQPAVVEPSLLVVSELVTNAVLHGNESAGDEDIALVLDAPAPTALHVSVENPGPAFDMTACLHEPAHVSAGRGLKIVAHLARDLSAECENGRTTVACLVVPWRDA